MLLITAVAVYHMVVVYLTKHIGFKGHKYKLRISKIGFY